MPVSVSIPTQPRALNTRELKVVVAEMTGISECFGLRRDLRRAAGVSRSQPLD